MCIVHVALRPHVTKRQNARTQQLIVVSQKATCFGCMRQSSSGFTSQKYKKAINLAVAIHKPVKLYGRYLAYYNEVLCMDGFS
jgi:ribosomal protein S17